MTTSTFAFIFAFDFLSFSFVLCDHVFDDHSMTQNFKTFYNMYLIENAKTLRCNWYVQTKRTQKIYHVRKHELIMKSKIKQKAKKLLKQQKKARLIKKRVEKYTCRRCKTIKFDNNIKFHEHIRIRHAKKSKSTFVQQFVEFVVSFAFESIIFSFFVSSSRSIIFSSFSSSKFLFFSMFTSEIVRERSKNVLFISSIATSKKSIFWTKIVSRSVVASKFSRFSIATSKSIYNILKKSTIICSFASFTSSRISISKHQNIRKSYFIMNDLIRMFVEKSNSFDLQQHQIRSLFSRDFDKCNFANKCDFIQNRITSYFHATISSVSKSIKFETFESTHVRENVSRQFSISRWFSISFIFFSFRFVSMRFFFSTFSRSFFVCKHCQERSVIYRFIDWVMSNVSKIENNEIFMKQRYWNFVSFRSTLKEYWSFWNHYFEKVNMLFVCFDRSFSLIIVDRFEET